MIYPNESGKCEPQTAYSFMMSYPPKEEPVLKPCPFCGKDVELKHYKANGDDWWYIACRHCGIAVDPWMWNSHQTRTEAIEKWNRRVNE